MSTSRHLFKVVFSLLFLLCPAAGFPGTWQSVEEHARGYASQARQDLEQTRARIEWERQAILAELTGLQESVAREEARLGEVRSRFDGLVQQEKEARARFHQEELDAEKLVEVYLTSAKDAQALLASSLLKAESPHPPKSLGEAESQEQAPSFADIQKLIDELLAEMKASGQIERHEGTFIGSEGAEVTGEILHAGDFNAFYRTSDSAGFLKLDKATGRLSAIPASSSWLDNEQAVISDYWDGTVELLPVDLSRGEVFARIAEKKTLLEYLNSGGPLVWPIILLGLTAFVLIVERFIFLARTKTNSQKLIAAIQQLAASGSWQECREVFVAHPKSSVCRVLRAGLGNLGNDREVLENTLQEAIMKELPRLERFLSTLSVLAAVAPLLGLLGTVGGMINTFNAITVYGSGDPRMLSAGISEALITTELGLVVAVPVLLLHHFLESRVDAIIGDMEEKSTALTVILLKNRGKHAGMAEQAA